MRIVDLEWFAFITDFSSGALSLINVLGKTFSEEIFKRVNSKDNFRIYDYKSLKEFIKQSLMYRYWSRSEYEVLVTGLHSKLNEDTLHKIDVWYQLEPNLDRICEYVIREMKLDYSIELNS